MEWWGDRGRPNDRPGIRFWRRRPRRGGLQPVLAWPPVYNKKARLWRRAFSHVTAGFWRLPAERQPRAQDQVVLELPAAVEIAAVEEVFSLESHTDRRRKRDADAEPADAAPVRPAFSLVRDIVTDANERRSAAQEDSNARRRRGQAEHELRAADEHLGVAVRVDGRASHAHMRGRETT